MKSNYSMEMKYEVIMNFLRKSGNKGFSQGEIARALIDDLDYASEESARVSIGKMMKDLNDKDLVYFEKKKAIRGNIPMKVWYIKND